MQIGVAHPARLHLHHRLIRAPVGDVDRDDLDRRPLLRATTPFTCCIRLSFVTSFVLTIVMALQYWCTSQAQNMFRHVMAEIATMIGGVLRAPDDVEMADVRAQAGRLCAKFTPYPA